MHQVLEADKQSGVGSMAGIAENRQWLDKGGVDDKGRLPDHSTSTGPLLSLWLQAGTIPPGGQTDRTQAEHAILDLLRCMLEQTGEKCAMPCRSACAGEVNSISRCDCQRGK